MASAVAAMRARAVVVAASLRRARGRVPVAHQHVRDPVGRVRRSSRVLFWWRGGPALRSPAARGARWRSRSPSCSRSCSTTRTSSTPTGPSWRGSARRRRRRHRMPADAASPTRLLSRAALSRISTSASRRWSLAAWGAALLWQRGARDRLTLAIAGWALACACLPGARHPHAGRHALLPRRDSRRRDRRRRSARAPAWSAGGPRASPPPRCWPGRWSRVSSAGGRRLADDATRGRRR